MPNLLILKDKSDVPRSKLIKNIKLFINIDELEF